MKPEIEEKFYNLKYDRMFKAVVANPNDTRLLNCILSDILDEDVYVIEFVPNELKIRNKKERVKVTDVIVKTNDGKKILIELNINFDETIKIRNLSYFASYYAEQVQRGEEYDDNMEVIEINLNYGKTKDKKYKKRYYLMEEETKEIYTKNFAIINVNIEKYKNKWYDECIKGNKKHIYIVMLDANKEEIAELGKKDKIIKECSEKMYMLNKDGVLINTISYEEDQEKIHRSRESRARKEGLAKGEISGLAKGKAKMAKEIAKNLLNMDIKIEDIVKATSLSEKEILKLKK